MSHLYFYNNLVNKTRELSEIAQTMIGNGEEMRKIVLELIKQSLEVQSLASLALKIDILSHKHTPD